MYQRDSDVLVMCSTVAYQGLTFGKVNCMFVPDLHSSLVSLLLVLTGLTSWYNS